jgi:hypothetical protein
MGRGLELLVLELLDEADPLGDLAAVDPLAFETLAELGIEHRAVPKAEVIDLPEEATSEGGDRKALCSEQSLDAVGDTGSSGLEREELAVKVARILGLGRGHMDNGPDPDLAVVVTDEHTEELAGVDAVGLETTAAAVDLDGSGVDDEVVLSGLGLEETVDPEAVTASLEAGDERHGVRESEASAGERDLAGERVEVSGRHVAETGLLAVAGREGQLPGAVGEF